MKTINIRNISFNDGPPKICVPVSGITDAEILHEIDILEAMDFDLLELRADYFEFVEDFSKVTELLKKIRAAFHKPLLFTFRTIKEGGVYEMPEEKYFALNEAVIRSNAVDIIDIELFSNPIKIAALIKLAKANNVKVIMSNHDFLKTPPKEEIISRLVKMQEYDTDITKIAVMPQCEEDVITLLEATLEMKKIRGDRPCITMSMGSMGIISRLSGELFGSCMTFAASGKPSAPGQLNVKDLRNLLTLLTP